MSTARTQLKTRRPTGKPSWPLLLLAGGEKCGKSYAAAAFSASDLIDRTFWIEIGEGAADLYGAIPGARYEIVEHNGSYPALLEVAEIIIAQSHKGKPHAVVVDSVTELWDLLANEQAAIARKRGKDTITMDQWNVAKRRWRAFLDTIRKNAGPVIFTARYEQVSVVVDGKPLVEKGKPVKEWKVRAEKNLAFEVDGTLEIPKPREFYLNGMRSLALSVPVGGHLKMPDDFTIDAFFRKLGLGPGTGERVYVAPQEDRALLDESAPGDEATADPSDPDDPWAQDADNQARAGMAEHDAGATS